LSFCNGGSIGFSYVLSSALRTTESSFAIDQYLRLGDPAMTALTLKFGSCHSASKITDQFDFFAKQF